MLLRSGIRLLWPALQIPNAGLFRSVETVAHFVRGSRINRRARDRRAGVDRCAAGRLDAGQILFIQRLRRDGLGCRRCDCGHIRHGRCAADRAGGQETLDEFGDMRLPRRPTEVTMLKPDALM